MHSRADATGGTGLSLLALFTVISSYPLSHSQSRADLIARRLVSRRGRHTRATSAPQFSDDWSRRISPRGSGRQEVSDLFARQLFAIQRSINLSEPSRQYPENPSKYFDDFFRSSPLIPQVPVPSSSPTTSSSTTTSTPTSTTTSTTTTTTTTPDPHQQEIQMQLSRESRRIDATRVGSVQEVAEPLSPEQLREIFVADVKKRRRKFVPWRRYLPGIRRAFRPKVPARPLTTTSTSTTTTRPTTTTERPTTTVTPHPKAPDAATTSSTTLAPASTEPSEAEAPTSQGNEEILRYVVEGDDYHQYRLEERTKDGLIRGEYGLLNHKGQG
ncbi:unnamed protein product [Cyprideis torosa]|uniref:Uncharacterized protein n=1 Tax=Cyprideis torosa TaxID=163714 RepID=A0A7R8WCW7_9CRUS|nr:unnamed protein product [Cyprideis torosa]CAG0888360.1 unnamed protein product [Cyprideis torosa]